VTRAYDEFLADIFDVLSPTWVALILLGVAVAVGLLWYTYPAWLRIRLPRPHVKLPRRAWPKWKWPKWKWPRWKWRRPRIKRTKRKKQARLQVSTPAPAADHALQHVHAISLSPADRMAAEGRYAEAIRERLRESVTTLTSYGVIAPVPARTAQELTTEASANRPAVATPLAGATGIFSEVWYGRRPAGPDQDALMRRLTAEVKAALETHR
jgi:hypothetical protein